jgi:hypothetical protein
MTKQKTGVSAEVAQLVVARDLWSCVCCGRNVLGLERGVDWSIHHRIPRGMGGSRDPRLNLPANLLTTCGNGTQGCHGEIERLRAKSRARGLLVWRSQDPAEVPVEVCVGRASGLYPIETELFLHDNDGGRTAVDHGA